MRKLTPTLGLDFTDCSEPHRGERIDKVEEGVPSLDEFTSKVLVALESKPE